MLSLISTMTSNFYNEATNTLNITLIILPSTTITKHFKFARSRYLRPGIVPQSPVPEILRKKARKSELYSRTRFLLMMSNLIIAIFVYKFINSRYFYVKCICIYDFV